MALTAAQIVTLATQIAKAPGFTSQAGQLLNAILTELCQNYDFAAAGGSHAFSFDGTIGPYAMPADYLRMEKDTFHFVIDGVPYYPKYVTFPQYQQLVQIVGNQSYPVNFTTDPDTSPVELFVWPAPSGAYAAALRYYRTMPEIATPESSASVPWFPNQTYLIRRLAGELMQITGDSRILQFLGDDDDAYPLGAGTLLRKYLKMKDDSSNEVKTVSLDRQRFGSNFRTLPNTKTIGW